MINIAEILKNHPEITHLYSTTLGNCTILKVGDDIEVLPVAIGIIAKFDKYGRTCVAGECLLFPSKSIRNWNSYNVFLNNTIIKEKHQFKPFDKVLVRDKDSEIWHIDLFEQYVADEKCPYRCMTTSWKQCIPCNEETEKLIDTSNDYITNAN